jgi:hypothetical protein
MTYERDRDHALKGVGAIAARDAGNQNRSALRVQQARMTQARDRSMARIGYDARGLRRGALGAVDQQTTDVWAGPVSDIPARTKLYQGAGSFPIPTRTPTTVSATVAYPPTTTQSPPFVPVYVQSPPFVGPTMPVLTAPPIQMPPSASPVMPGTTTGLTDTQKKWALIGAAGLAAYFLFRGNGAAAT